MTLNTTFRTKLVPEFVKTISKKYNGYIKYLEYHRAWKPTQGERVKRRARAVSITEERLKQLRSVIRARTTIHDIVACNTFEYFATLTISSEAKFNRYDYDECTKYISKWLNNHLSHYILVPEKHKDGAFHFHLLADIPKHKLTHFKGSLYNIKSYKYGFSSAKKIKQGTERYVGLYISKYITKELMSTVGKNRKTYWCSKDLKRPEVEYNVEVPHQAEKVFEAEHMDIYHLDNDHIGQRVEPDETA